MIATRVGAYLLAALGPTLLAVTYVLNAWVNSASSVFAVGRALVGVVVAAQVITLVSLLVMRDPRRAALIGTAIVAVIIFGRNVSLIGGNLVTALPAWQLAILFLLILMLVVVVLAVGRRSGARPPRAEGLLVPVLAMVCVGLVLVLVSAGTRGLLAQTPEDLGQGVGLSSAPNRSAVPREGPDIYLILLDGYPRADVLRQQFGFDNSAFLDALRDRGLDVSDASHSNYPLTEYTLLSMLNQRLLPDIPELGPVLDQSIPGQPTSRRLLNDNPTFGALRERGYAIVGFAGAYEDVTPREAEVFLQTDQINELEWTLLANTFLLDVLDWAVPDFLANQQRAFVNSAFERADEVARDRTLGPRLLLAHVFAPRTPLVFGPNGEPLDMRSLRHVDDTAAGAGLSLDEYAERLVGQVHYVNGKTLDMIDTILAESPEPPIIILFSDHGSRSVPLDPVAPTPEVVRERFGSLFAALTPKHPDLFPENVTPVQVMGRLMNAYFDIPYEEPGTGIYAVGKSQYDLTYLGEAPPTPAP